MIEGGEREGEGRVRGGGRGRERGERWERWERGERGERVGRVRVGESRGE